jgi:hypothetical protein
MRRRYRARHGRWCVRTCDDWREIAAVIGWLERTVQAVATER